jgi:alanine racemase
VQEASQAFIHLDRLTRNLRLLQDLAGPRPLWPCVKANAYGHGLEIIVRHLESLSIDTVCVAHVSEAVSLRQAGVEATIVVLSAPPPEACGAIVEHRLEPVVGSREVLESLSQASADRKRPVSVHLKVDTGMGRIGVSPEQMPELVAQATALEGISVRGLMSHFSLADEPESTFSQTQIEAFERACAETAATDIPFRHMANSAAIFDWPESRFDAVRPGIAMYGLRPSTGIAHPRAAELEPVLDWVTRLTFLKEVPAGVGLSYGHTFRTERPSLIGTFPVGYGDGLPRSLSNRMEVLVGGQWCPQVGTITMDQTLVDVTALRGRVDVGDPVVLVGQQGAEQAHVDQWAETLSTINYEIVTGISARVPRIPV